MEDIVTRLIILSQQMSLEQDVGHPGTSDDSRQVAGAHPYTDTTVSIPDNLLVHGALLPNGGRIKLLKTLLSSVCEKDCFYCPFRSGRDLRRSSFQPDEFARLFMMLFRKGIADGVFLSSGISGGGPCTQERLIATAEILRQRYHFHGYIHLKIMPGAEFEQIEQAMLLANRVSVNLEAPTEKALHTLAPQKQFHSELIQPLAWMEKIRREKIDTVQNWKIANQVDRWASSSTQFVTGCAGETDHDYLSTTLTLFQKFGLTRIYYSPFSPIPGTPMENRPSTPVIRERRLYQASFLLRDYEYALDELPIDSKSGNLPLDIDPKLGWARQNLLESPIEVNTADRCRLIRIPGIGLRCAEKIIAARRHHIIHDPSQLKKIGVPIEKAAPYLLLNGTRPTVQADLF